MFAASKSAGGRLITQTFTADGTWVAPANTNNLITLVGEGQDGTAEQWTGLGLSTNVLSVTGCADPVYGATLNYSVPYGQAQSFQTTASGWTTNPAGQSVSLTIRYVYFWCPATSNWRVQDITFSGDVRRTGTVNLTGPMPSSGAVPTPPSTVQFAECTNVEFKIPATTGASTTAFGYTFAGGVGVPATPVTVNNVAVTPGASYSIVVPVGGSVTITYVG